MTTDMTAAAVPGAAEELAGRMFSAGVGAGELCTAYLGIHLGLYRALADAPASAAELTECTGCDERYLREWLQAQARRHEEDLDLAAPLRDCAGSAVRAGSLAPCSRSARRASGRRAA